ncbi:Homeodomain-like superfamily protein [Zea mays]|uniref:Homeodomain-like superfamily protein n=1 Tax=Zea mays TaxID=4577 RepID=A0A1D6Q313_MAIZE|nr:Homeodomain-like superfamily protein [Zea mays]
MKTPGIKEIGNKPSCARALISGSSQASGHRINLDTHVLNTRNEKIVRVPSEKQLAQSHRVTNVAGPVSNSKQLAHIGPSAGLLDPNGPSKKRKKPKAWSKEEDADLAAGVQKYGEGNWEDILHKCNFDNTRTPDQLSQRWALKRAYPQSIQHKSTVFAPKMPELRSAVTPSPAPAVPVPVAMPLRVAAQVQAPPHQGHQAPAHAAPPKLLNASNKTRKKQAAQPNPTISPSSIQAAAIAAGGRLATASTAANFLKVAQSKNAVHIRSLGATSLKPSASFKASIVVEHGTQPGGSQHLEPLNASAVHDVSGVAAVNQSGPLAGACSETKKALSTALAPVPCDSEEKEDDSEFCVITIDDLFPEDAKQPETVDTKAKQPQTTGLKANQPENADPKVMQQETMDPKSKQSDTVEVEIVDPKDKDMLEFDQYVASQGGHLNTDDLNKSKCTNSVSQAQGLVGSQQKLIPADGKGSPVTVVGKGKPVTAGVAATGRKTKFPVSHLAAGTPRGIVDTVNANAPNKTLVRRAAIPAPVPAGCQVRKDAMNSKGNQMTPGNAGSGVPASSQTSVAAQAASKANLPSSSSQAKPNNMVVNGGNRLVVNPPSSSQASAAVNDANRAATPQSSNPVNGANNREVNPPPSSQASTAVNGAANKGNVPAAARPP